MSFVVQHHTAGLAVHETGAMARAMHALRDGERTWLIDPFHAAELRDALGELSPPAGSSCSIAATATVSRSPAASICPRTGSPRACPTAV